jgi:tRNA(adenine34) deaminase
MDWGDDDRKWMRRAIALAREGYAEPGKNGIGCIIVRNGEIIGEGCNEVERRHRARRDRFDASSRTAA